LEIVLEEEINKIDGVTITAGAFEASDKKKSVVLRTLDIVSTAGATADITGVMNTLPGTQTVGEEGRLFVRGGAGHEAKTFINGLLVAEPYGSTPQNIPSRFRFSPFLFKGAFFSTGGYSAEYGQALSSVLQLNTYDLPARSQTDISVMSVGTDISQTIRKNNTSVYGQLQYTDLTGYFVMVPQKYEWDRAPNSFNSTLHFKQQFSTSGSIQAYTNYAKSGMKLFQPTPGNFYTESKYIINTDDFYSNVAINNTLGSAVSYRGGISYSFNTNHIKTEDMRLDSRMKAMHVKLAFDHDISENILIKYGGELMTSEYEEDISDNENQLSQKFSFSNQLLSPFAEVDIYFSNKLMARLGNRYEFNELLGSHNFLPRASLAYKMHKYSQVSLAYGRFSQLPIAEYLKWSDDLSPEKASHYILNYQYSREGRIFRSEVYYKKYQQLVTFDMSNNNVPLHSNAGYGDAKGFELFWRDSKTLKGVDYWISYSYLDTKRKYGIFPYQVMPYYASTHNLSVVYKHFISAIKSQIGWTYSFASGRPYTDPNTEEYNSKMTKNYNDFSVNYSYLVKPNMIIHASMSNVFGFNNVFGYQYNSEPNQQGAFESIPIEPQAKRFIFVGFFITISKDKNANQLNNL
jgi:outer membrane cobalamin receptor